jgi:cytoskeletal protein CcmA (bactofilin family)
MALHRAMVLDVVVQDAEEAAAAAGPTRGEILVMLMPTALREGMVVVAALETVELLAVKMVRGGRQRGAVGRASLTVEVGAVVVIPMGSLGMSSDVLAGHMSATAAQAVVTR